LEAVAGISGGGCRGIEVLEAKALVVAMRVTCRSSDSIDLSIVDGDLVAVIIDGDAVDAALGDGVIALDEAVGDWHGGQRIIGAERRQRHLECVRSHMCLVVQISVSRLQIERSVIASSRESRHYRLRWINIRGLDGDRISRAHDLSTIEGDHDKEVAGGGSVVEDGVSAIHGAVANEVVEIGRICADGRSDDDVPERGAGADRRRDYADSILIVCHYVEVCVVSCVDRRVRLYSLSYCP